MGRLLRLIVATAAFPLVIFAMGIMAAAGYAFRKREEDEELLELVQEAAIQAPQEIEGDHDDRQRRWPEDLSPEDRLDALTRSFEEQGREIVPDEPKAVWARRRHPEYYQPAR